MKLPALLPNPPTPVHHWGEVLHRLAKASRCRTQRELAELLHVAPGTLNRYLTCERLPDPKLVTNLVGLARTNDNGLDTAAVQRAYNEAVQAFETWPPSQRNGHVEPSPPSEDKERKDAPEPRDEDPHQAGDGSVTTRRQVSTALITVWTRFSRLSTRSKVLLVGVAVAAVAGLLALLIRPWETSNESNSPDPLPLRRYQAPTPDRANFISPTQPGPPGWAAMPSLGEVYAPNETGVDGLVPIHRYRCTNCQAMVYFLSRDSSQRSNFEYEAEAFRCFDPNNPPSGTRPLQSLSNNKTHARMWAIPGTSEYQEAIANGFKDPNPDGLPLCYIW